MIGEESPLCDRCADEVIASRTGWPQLEDRPPPDLFRGPDGIEHRMVYRVLRTPGGIEVLAEEDDLAVDNGYRLALLGPHDADVGAMREQLRRMVRSAIGHQYLERSLHRDGWVMRGMEVEGRLVWRDDRPGYDVVVDGRRLTWEEFGDALEPFEGWTFRPVHPGDRGCRVAGTSLPGWGAPGGRVRHVRSGRSRRECCRRWSAPFAETSKTCAAEALPAAVLPSCAGGSMLTTVADLRRRVDAAAALAVDFLDAAVDGSVKWPHEDVLESVPVDEWLMNLPGLLVHAGLLAEARVVAGTYDRLDGAGPGSGRVPAGREGGAEGRA